MRYHKIYGPFKRDDQGILMTHVWHRPEFGALLDVPIWNATEKLDGMNIRVIWDGRDVTFAGKSDHANLPPALVKVLVDTFPPYRLAATFDDIPATLYGEGYGGKIQRGGRYRPDPSFALFDVRAGGLWLRRAAVAQIAADLDAAVVPTTYAYRTLRWLIERASDGMKSLFGDTPSEGLVARTELELRDRRGDRIICKLRTRDMGSSAVRAWLGRL